RDDANPDGIENRLRRFHSDTEPLLDLYARRGILTTVDASVSAEATTSAILGSLRVIRRVSPAGSWLL
ncbi:MAG: hypothetical protein JWL73_3350, partial [Actinomycetia bacterium]|nr:hypothetical protein [Actinomycetes bacterium]